MKRLQFLRNSFFKRQVLVGLSRREKVEDINPVKFRSYTVNSPHALHYSRWISRQVVDKNAGTVQNELPRSKTAGYQSHYKDANFAAELRGIDP